jgi:hypothetical protein
MSVCDKNRVILDDWVAGLDGLENLDNTHCRECADCAEALRDARRLKECLHSWAGEIEEEARRAAKMPPRFAPSIPRNRSFRRIAPWLAAPAAAALIWWVGPGWFRSEPPRPALPSYLASLETEATRADLVSFLSQSQLFLLGLLDQTLCHADPDSQRRAAERLIQRKRQLEPRLGSDAFADVRPVFEELEVLLLVVADEGGCLEDGELGQWRRLIEGRSTLLRINLLQMEDRL